MIRRHFLAGVVGLKAMCAAAALMVGVGQAEAATARCERSDAYDPPIYGTKLTYDFDVFIRQGFIDNEDNPIEAYGPYSKNVAVPMRANITSLPADYCADITLSSLGQTWQTTESFGTLGFVAFGNTADGGRFVFSLFNDLIGDSLDIEWHTADSYAWVLLDIENVRLAPVPLPATAALLPVGIGALAMMRKRRKSGQAGTV